MIFSPKTNPLLVFPILENTTIIPSVLHLPIDCYFNTETKIQRDVKMEAETGSEVAINQELLASTRSYKKQEMNYLLESQERMWPW